MTFTIESDGTRKGTKFMVDGTEITDLASAEIFMGEFSDKPFISWSRQSEDEDSMIVTEERFHLSRSSAGTVLGYKQDKTDNK